MTDSQKAVVRRIIEAEIPRMKAEGFSVNGACYAFIRLFIYDDHVDDEYVISVVTELMAV